MPANRAGKRLGCSLGTVFLGGATLAFAADMELTGRILAGQMAAAATFVAATNICVPSIILTLALGVQRVTAPRLIPVGRR